MEPGSKLIAILGALAAANHATLYPITWKTMAGGDWRVIEDGGSQRGPPRRRKNRDAAHPCRAASQHLGAEPI